MILFLAAQILFYTTISYELKSLNSTLVAIHKGTESQAIGSCLPPMVACSNKSWGLTVAVRVNTQQKGFGPCNGLGTVLLKNPTFCTTCSWDIFKHIFTTNIQFSTKIFLHNILIVAINIYKTVFFILVKFNLKVS